MIPWFQLISTGASLAEIAKDVYLKQRDRGGKEKEILSTDELVAKIKIMEENELKQAALISGMANQIQKLTRRMAVYFIISLLAMLIAIISIFF